MKRLIAIIPNVITLCNLLCGSLAIYSLFLADVSLRSTIALIVLAMVFDFFDGFVARLLHAESTLGGDLDSLSDLVSFGVAPILIVIHPFGFSLLTAIPLLIVVMLGAFRLARYNNESVHTSSFVGMPIPANALFWLGYALISADLYHEQAFSQHTFYFFTLMFSLLMGGMMVSRIKFLSLKGLTIKTVQGKRTIALWILLLILLLLLTVLFGIKSIAPFVLCYIVISCVSSFVFPKIEK